MTLRVLLALAFAPLADYLVYGHRPGAGCAVLALLVAALAWWRYRGGLRRAGAWGGLWLLLAASAAFEPSATGLLLLFPLGWATLAMARSRKPLPFVAAIGGGLAGGLRSLFAVPRDAARFTRLRAPLWVYVVPAAVVGVFALVLLPANPVLLRWARRSVDLLNPGRTFLWIAAFAVSYGVLRFRPQLRMRYERGEPRPPDERRLRDELRACLATLLGVNAIFLALNVADLLYLWGRFELPEGVTYSEFAHRGAYRLIVGVLLAAVTVESFLRRGAGGTRSRAARGLAFALLAQNLVVSAGAGLRLYLYAEAYGLTRFRVATVFWLALVVAGLVLVAVRIRGGRPFAFLVEANARSTVIVLALWAVANVDGFIATWNVDRYMKDQTRGVDIAYLSRLGPSALPALARLARSGDAAVVPHASLALDAGLARFSTERPWPAWSYRLIVNLSDARK
jgi:hypothetical protein